MTGQLKRKSLKDIPTPAANDVDSENENPYEKMLDSLENVCGHTPFFVAVVKNHLRIAQLLL